VSSPARIAVIVPCYNDGRHLPDALASLADQEPHELVVVDDGSSDPGTLDVLHSLEGEGVRVVHQGNAGPAAARNHGADLTRAPYLFFLDADDRLVPGALAALADALDADPGAQLAWGDMVQFGAGELYAPRAPALDPWLITYVNGLPAAALVRRAALDSVGGWELRHNYEDWDLWLKLAGRGYRGIHLPRPMFERRVHPGVRRWTATLAKHDEFYAELRARHRELFASRRRNWRRSPTPLPVRLIIPAVAKLPRLDERQRQRYYSLGLRLGAPSHRWREADGRVVHPIWSPIRRRLQRLAPGWRCLRRR
jgi:glycosyltransferase involved in cell wall biosynthesis